MTLNININTIIIFYLIITLGLIVIYMYTSNKIIIRDIVGILSGTTIILGLMGYVTSEQERTNRENRENKLNYINNVSSVFNKIDNMYLEYPESLHNLYYEFYGYNNFPIKNNENNENKLTKHNNNVTSKEYIAINIIIEYFNNIYITNPEIFEDLNFRNKIINYLKSEKFKKVLSYTKNNYSPDFINLLNEQDFINTNELQVETIDIPILIK
jgi:hypothetical protein